MSFQDRHQEASYGSEIQYTMRDLLSDKLGVDMLSYGSVCGCHLADCTLRHRKNGDERVSELNGQSSDSRREPGDKIRRGMADTRQNVRLLSKMDRCRRRSKGESSASASSLELPRQGYPVSLSCFSLSVATAKDLSAITFCPKAGKAYRSPSKLGRKTRSASNTTSCRNCRHFSI